MMKRMLRTITLGLALFVALLSANVLFSSSAQIARPVEFDVRGPLGVPTGTALRAPNLAQVKALTALQSAVGNTVEVRYNGLTATPRFMFSHSAYLSPKSSSQPETIARGFISRNRELYRFSDEDLSNLRLKSRAYIPDTGTTVMLFEQQADGLPVYHGEVLVNVNRLGEIISVGGESFPQLKIANAIAITPEQAVTAAATALGVINFAPTSIGTKQVLTTYGNLTPQYVQAPMFSGGGAFTDKIVVTKVVFPLGDVGRLAYRFVLTTPQYQGIMWENTVDAQTGQVLRRISLTSFNGPRGGGQGVGRLPTFRPDIQDRVEAMNPNGTAQGKVFDSMPTALSGVGGFGEVTAAGNAPGYTPDSTTTGNGRGFRESLVLARNENPLAYSVGFGQVIRGLPDAANPSAESPFGWFYLPTDTGGSEIVNGNANRAATRALGYTMDSEAQGRNLAANSPVADKSQPFSATLTPLSSTATLTDGRSLSMVYQSSYTEGNNVLSADDHANDDEATQGIKGYSPTRQFTASYFDYINSYEFGHVDAGGTPFFPPSTFADVYPGTVSLFYFNNLIHDYLYSIGFTESLWNFQQDNFGRGGAGNDGISAQVQDGSGTDNANFGTPDDGAYPRMQMFLFTQASFRRSDGDFDFDVIAHEHYHGVSNRSIAKGGSGGLGFALVGESGGQGEGWSDYNAESIVDDDCEGEYVTGVFDAGIRRLPVTNYRWSYGSLNGTTLMRRDGAAPDVNAGAIPFEVHDIGELWSAVLWDMRELLIVKDPNGIFFDGTRRLGNGTSFYIGDRQVHSVDSLHPINYREAFSTNDPATVTSQAIVRPGQLAAEIAQLGNRNGPLATAIRRGAKLSDTLVLRGMQLSPLNPSFVDSRDSILLADRELTGGENQAIIWRAFASHGVGAQAKSTSGLQDDIATQSAPVVIEDFTVPSTVTDCEALGPLPAPPFTVSNLIKNTATINVNDGIRVPDAQTYIIARGSSADGPFTTIAEIPAIQTVFRDDNGGQKLQVGQTYFYQVHASRNPECISSSNIVSVVIAIGDVINVSPSPAFDGVDQVSDTRQCNRLTVSWKAAASANPNANIVYDVFRAGSVAPGDGTQDPTFTPSTANRVAAGLTGLSYVDSGLSLGHAYYYIVQARDLNNGKKDTNNVGNTLVKFSAPTTNAITAAPAFAMENFESASPNTSFVPPLVDTGTPNQAAPVFQHVSGIQVNGATSSMMYAPDFNPSEGAPDPAGTGGGAPSDFSTVIGPLTLTSTSLMEFDHFFKAEFSFDGGVIEVAVGTPVFNSAPFPDNTTTFDVGNYIIDGGYNSRLDGSLEGVTLGSVLQGRRGYTGTKGYHHVRIVLGSFAAGGANNPNGLPVFLRFRMTSDVATAIAGGGGWYIDNLVINNLNAAACSTGLATVSPSHATGGKEYALNDKDCLVVRRRAAIHA